VIPLGWGFIRGYAAPRYEKAANETGGNTGTGKKSVEAVAKEVPNITVCVIIKMI